MTARPPHWQVLSRAHWSQRLLLVLAAFLLLFLGSVTAAGLAAFGLELWRGTRRLGESLPDMVGGAMAALVGPFLLWAFLRHGFGSLFDALGAERTLEGVVEHLEARRSSRGTSYSMVVAGHHVALSWELFQQLKQGGHVWVRTGRFEHEVKELAVPEPHRPPPS